MSQHGPQDVAMIGLAEIDDALSRGLAEAAMSPAWKAFKRDARTIWVDVDATLAIYHGWDGIYRIGPPIGGAIQFMLSLRALGKRLDFRIGLYTVRTTLAYPGREQVLDSNPQVGTEPEMVAKLVQIVEQWAISHGIEFDQVWTGQGKPVGICYIDDRGIHCSPQEDGPVAFTAALGMVEMMASPKKR